MTEQQSGSTDAKDVKNEKTSYVIALGRGLEILQCFTMSRVQLGSADIARLTQLPQPTVWRLCQTLQHHGFLLPVPGSQRFQLGTAALALGTTAATTFDALSHAKPRMQHIADTYQTAVSITSRENLEVVYVERCAAEVMVSTNTRKGSRLPLHKCTPGWAFLVALPESKRKQLIDELCSEFPGEADRIHGQILNALHQYEDKGYLLAKGLVHQNIISVAIPICTAEGPLLAINCSSDIAGMSVRRLTKDIAPALQEIAKILEAALNHPTSAERHAIY